MASVDAQLDRARKNELLDLTLRNPLISYRTLKSRGVEVIDERATQVHRLLVDEERRLSFNSVSDEQRQKLNGESEGEPEADQYELVFGQPDKSSGPEEPAPNAEANSPAERHTDTVLQTPYTSPQLQQRLLNTYYHAQQSLQEEGINTLYLALGMLRWYRSPDTDTERSAPLLLVPVSLDRTDVQGRFRLTYTGGTVGGNLSLRAFLEGEFGLDWPLPDTDDAHSAPLDVAAYTKALRSVIEGRSRWSIAPNAMALGFFSFTRFLMFEDLDAANWPEDQQPGDHPVLRKVLDEGFSVPEGRIPNDAHLDDHLAPEDTHHVVDADSSQTRAVLDVKQGCNLVLQGPPGTGKSQTITNIIAEAIGQGQRVLFVSEKAAALDVVKRNLDQVGLGDACLELHSHKTRKKSVLNELQRTLKLGRPTVDDAAQHTDVFLQARQRLNDYADAVNTPVGQSSVRPYVAYGKLAHLRDALSEAEPPTLTLPTAQSWTKDDFDTRRFLVEQVASHLDGMGVPVRHPFWGCEKEGYLPEEQDAIEQAARTARKALRALETTTQALAEQLCLNAPPTPQSTDRLEHAATWAANAPNLSGVDVKADVWRANTDALHELVEAGRRYAELHATYDDTLIPEAWTQDVFAMRQALAKHNSKWYRWFIGDWRRAKSELAALCQGPLPDDSEDRVALLDAILEAQRLESTLTDYDTIAADVFGPAWRGTSSDWERLHAITEALTALHDAIAADDLPADVLDALPLSDTAALADHLDTLHTRRTRYHEAADAFATSVALNADVRFEQGPLHDQPYDVQAELLDRCEAAVPRIQQMITYNTLANDLAAKDLESVEQVARTWDEAPAHLVDLFDRAYYAALVRRAIEERPALKTFSGEQHEQVAEKFRELDRASLQHNRHELALKHYEQMPPPSGAGQMGVLMHEFGKKSRHMPIRLLMQRAGNAIQALKPVFMMSPMSVPKYLPPASASFDLVVFDEASQVRPVDAFGAILRGDQTVVVGDSKQLPPTDFFDAAIDTSGDDFAQQAGDQESVLDLFRSKGAPEQMLRFHYRSRHESLIAVSNKAFYDNNLNVFPSPSAEQGEIGLVYNHLPDTVYDRGGSRQNKKEAQTVAERVMEHARTRPDMSLGVATFSSAQQDAIRDRLEHLRRDDPSCESFFTGHPTEPFFVKNLESVQGDQRDVMYISVGYGRDANGKVTMNFGPLNREGGERRLNVLTTRAKYRCEVFTNLKADDIDLHRTNARGVQVLKEYLKFAETGELDVPTVTGGGPDSPFESAVAQRLRSAGYRVEHQIGVAGFFIDLAVVDPEREGRYVLGIECDGATYHSAKMARVRDRTRQAVLENLGWRIHRIWSTDWFRTPDDEVKATIAAIERAQVEAKARRNREKTAQASHADASNNSTSDDEDTSSAPQHEEPAIKREAEEPIAANPVEAVPYEKAELTLPSTSDLSAIDRATRVQWICTVVERESPVHQHMVMRRIVDASGASRMGTRIKDALRDAIDRAEQAGRIERTGDVLTVPAQDDVPVRDRSALDRRERDIAYIPPSEIQEAARRIAEASFGVGRDELVQQTGRTLGFGRVGSKIRTHVDEAIASMLENEALVRENDHLVVP